jgi:hypothetical protein
MPAEQHWLALDRMFSHIVSGPEAARAQPRFAHRANALSDIYLPRLLETAQRCVSNEDDSTRQLAELRETHRQLSAALTAAWQRTPR